jgi:hypothetical protein
MAMIGVLLDTGGGARMGNRRVAAP